MGTEEITIDGEKFSEDNDLWYIRGVGGNRAAGLDVFNSFVTQDPDKIRNEIAKQLSNKENISDSPSEIQSNLDADSSYYDGTYNLVYGAMSVVEVFKNDDAKRIVIQDLQEMKKFSFSTVKTNSNAEPLSEFKKHLNKTIFKSES